MMHRPTTVLCGIFTLVFAVACSEGPSPDDASNEGAGATVTQALDAIACQSDSNCPDWTVCGSPSSNGSRTCVAGCHTDSQCGAPEQCQLQSCASPPCAGQCVARTCKIDADCPEWTICKVGNDGTTSTCTAGCRTDAECGAGDHCVSEHCSAIPCSSDDTCPDWTVCEPGPGCADKICVVGCRGDADCGFEEQCTKSECLTCPCPSKCARRTTPAFLDFEDATRRWQDNGTTGLSSNASHGSHSLEITRCGWHELNSPIFAGSELGAVSEKLTFSVFIPKNQSNPWWVGDVQLLVSIPSKNIYHQWVGQSELTSLARGEWTTSSIRFPSELALPLAQARDVQLHLVVNTSSCLAPVLVDYLRF